jgi:hypothetical protein
MPKLLLEAHELTNAEVDFVSLVKRGANRIPFRIVKEDTSDMLDLHKIGRKLFKQADPVPTVVAAVVRKGADLEAVKARLIEAGLSVEHVTEKDGVLVFAQPNVEAFDEGVVKLDDDVGLVVSGIAKAFESFNFVDTEFGKVFATEAFYPSLHMAKDMLTYTVGNIMSKAESPGAAAEAIAKAVDDFKAYVTALAAKIPQHAFKAENCGAKMAKNATACPSCGSVQKMVPATNLEASPTIAAPTDTRMVTQGTNNDIEGSPTNGNETPRNPPQKPGVGEKAPDNDIEEDPAVKKAEADQAALLKGVEAAVAGQIGGLFEGLKKQVTDSLGALQKDVAAVGDRLAQVEVKVAKAETAIAGTVTASPGNDRTVVQKGTTGVPPLLDTAFMKRDAA